MPITSGLFNESKILLHSDIKENEDRDLYLKYVKNQSALIPIEAKIRQEENNIKTHRRKMDEYCVSGDKNWGWRRQLIANAQARIDRWIELNNESS